MNRNRLQMNNAKTEVLLIASQSQLNKCVILALNVNGTMVPIGRMLKYLAPGHIWIMVYPTNII